MRGKGLYPPLGQLVWKLVQERAQAGVRQFTWRRPRQIVVGSWEDLLKTYAVEAERKSGKKLVYTEDLERKSGEGQGYEVRPRYVSLTSTFQDVRADEPMDAPAPRPISDPDTRVR